MTLKLPKIIAHRGASAYAPENTLEALKTASEMGAKWVEFDVKLTSDSVPVLFHDDTLERTTGSSGVIKERSWADLQDMDAGSWFSEGFSGARIPMLEEALDILLKHNMGANIEIKPCPGREIETAEVAMDLLSRVWDDMDQILISSFSHVSLETAHDYAEAFPRALLLETQWPENWDAFADHLDVKCINIDGRNATREQVETIIDTGRNVLAYTINDPFTAKKLLSWGVDGVFTDQPDLLDK